MTVKNVMKIDNKSKKQQSLSPLSRMPSKVDKEKPSKRLIERVEKAITQQNLMHNSKWFIINMTVIYVQIYVMFESSSHYSIFYSVEIHYKYPHRTARIKKGSDNTLVLDSQATF